MFFASAAISNLVDVSVQMKTSPKHLLRSRGSKEVLPGGGHLLGINNDLHGSSELGVWLLPSSWSTLGAAMQCTDANSQPP